MEQLSNYVPQLLSPRAATAEARVPKARASVDMSLSKLQEIVKDKVLHSMGSQSQR